MVRARRDFGNAGTGGTWNVKLTVGAVAPSKHATVFNSKGVQVTAGDSGDVGVGSIWNIGLTGVVPTPRFSAAASKRARSERAYSCRHHGCADGGEFHIESLGVQRCQTVQSYPTDR